MNKIVKRCSRALKPQSISPNLPVAPSTKKPRKKESEIQHAVLEWLNARGYCVWRNYVGPRIINVGPKKHFSPSPMAGLPDVIGVLKNQRGRMFAIEIKNDVGKLSEKQEMWIRRLEHSGALVIVTRDLDQVIDVLTREDVKDERSDSLPKD